MEIVSAPILVLVGAAGYLFFSLLVRKQTPLALVSAATCLCYIGFILTKLGFYETSEPAWNGFWLRLNIVFITLTALSILFFIKISFAPNEKRKDVTFIGVVFLAFSVFYIFELFHPLHERVHTIRESLLFEFKFRGQEPSGIDLVLYGFISIVFGYALFLLVYLTWRKQIRLQPWLFVYLVSFLLFASFDILIAFKVIPFMFFLTEYAMFFMILFISYVNSDMAEFAAENPDSQDLLSDYRESRYKLSLLEDVDVDSVIGRLDKVMTEDRLFLQSDINIHKTAKMLGIRYAVLSQVLNDRLHIEFRNYVNRFRIEEAKRLLASSPELSVITICFDVGFQSKSAFHNAFKKFAGTTPTQYRANSTR